MDMHEIEDEIKRLEEQNATYDICTRLAVLYSIKDHHQERVNVNPRASSEFIRAISGANLNQALEILDEHFEAIRMLYPKEYETIIKRIDNLKLNNF